MTSPLREYLEEFYGDEEFILFDSFDECVLGVSYIHSSGKHVLVYSYEKCIQTLEKEMSTEEAVEYFDFNVAGAYLGDLTPIILMEIKQ